MIPYLGEDFVRALLGLDACDGAAEAPLDLDDAKPLVTPAKSRDPQLVQFFCIGSAVAVLCLTSGGGLNVHVEVGMFRLGSKSVT